MTSTMKKPVMIGSAALAAAIGAALLSPAIAASAHGHVSGDSLVARAALTANADRGNIQYEPQSLEAPKGFPTFGPADGKLASAGQAIATNLDEQSADRWVKNDIAQGPVTVEWDVAANHKTTKWQYYMTTPGWDQNDELDRGDFELISTVEHDGSEASNNSTHEIDVPEDREGYHVIYAVWEIGDTPNAFYNVIDVNVADSDGPEEPGEPDTERPSDVKDPSALATSPTSVDVTWGAATDNVKVDHYGIVYDGQVRKTVSGVTTATTVDGLTPDRMYDFGVIAYDAAGNRSGYQPLAVKTPISDGTPTAPTGLHAMDVTTDGVELMWNAATDNKKVTGYQILRDGTVVDTTDKTSYTDATVAAGTAYTYTVRALDADGNTSLDSNALTVTTDNDGSDPELPIWDAFASYNKGDKVSHDGATYEAVQSYQGVGDPTWISALSLWKKI
jgi:chitin-binding protein